MNSGLAEYSTAQAEFQVMVHAKTPDEEPWQKLYEAELAYYILRINQQWHQQDNQPCALHHQNACGACLLHDRNQTNKKPSAVGNEKQTVASRAQHLQPQLWALFAYFDKDGQGVLSPTSLRRMMKAGKALGKRVAAPMAEILLSLSWDMVAEQIVKSHWCRNAFAEVLHRAGTSSEEMKETLRPDFKARDCFMIRFTRRTASNHFEQSMGDEYCAELQRALQSGHEGAGIRKQQFVEGVTAFNMKRMAHVTEISPSQITHNEQAELNEEIRRTIGMTDSTDISAFDTVTAADSTASSETLDKNEQDMNDSRLRKDSGRLSMMSVVAEPVVDQRHELEKSVSALFPDDVPLCIQHVQELVGAFSPQTRPQNRIQVVNQDHMLDRGCCVIGNTIFD